MDILDQLRTTFKEEGVGHAFGEAVLSAAKAAQEPDEDRQAEHLDEVRRAIRIEFGAAVADVGGGEPDEEPRPTRRKRRKKAAADDAPKRGEKKASKGPGTGRRYCAHCGEAKGNRAFEPGHEVCKECTDAGAQEPGEETEESE